MKIIFFTHPPFLGSQSMPRFAGLLANGMKTLGHDVKVWTPKALFSQINVPKPLKKWLGYIDQYILFPIEVRIRLRRCAPNTLFVFTDQALGPWVPLVADRPHAIHCHDFLAQRSAMNSIPENKTTWTGRLYQALIRKGYSQGKNFISVSRKTQHDLHHFLQKPPKFSEVVYNGLNQFFVPRDPVQARVVLENKLNLHLNEGYLLHVGGNQWYKNRRGVIEIYDAWRKESKIKLPLLMIGAKPNATLLNAYESSPFKEDIHFLSGLSDELVRVAYAGASLFLFPSLAEGFGWPIAEAMASGCPVITTNEAPMTEVASDAGFLIPRRPKEKDKAAAWAMEAAKLVHELLHLSEAERKAVEQRGLLNAQRFDPSQALTQIEEIYKNILKQAKYECTSSHWQHEPIQWGTLSGNTQYYTRVS